MQEQVVEDRSTDDLLPGLRAAFAAEAMTAQRYAYFAQTAEIEGRIDIARLFAELAESAACAAHGHLDVLQYVDPDMERTAGDTRANLAAALADALREASDFYPRLAATAHEAEVADVASWLETLTALKKAHLGRLGEALEAMEAADAGAPVADPAEAAS